jgi:dihydrofolate reductase
LRKQDGGDVIVWGSASLVTALLAEGLVDELNLMISRSCSAAASESFPRMGAHGR